jgi:hypothetical protein
LQGHRILSSTHELWLVWCFARRSKSVENRRKSFAF